MNKKEESHNELSSPMSVPSEEFTIHGDATSPLRHRYGIYLIYILYMYIYILPMNVYFLFIHNSARSC